MQQAMPDQRHHEWSGTTVKAHRVFLPTKPCNSLLHGSMWITCIFLGTIGFAPHSNPGGKFVIFSCARQGDTPTNALHVHIYIYTYSRSPRGVKILHREPSPPVLQSSPRRSSRNKRLVAPSSLRRGARNVAATALRCHVHWGGAGEMVSHPVFDRTLEPSQPSHAMLKDAWPTGSAGPQRA